MIVIAIQTIRNIRLMIATSKLPHLAAGMPIKILFMAALVGVEATDILNPYTGSLEAVAVVTCMDATVLQEATEVVILFVLKEEDLVVCIHLMMNTQTIGDGKVPDQCRPH